MTSPIDPPSAAGADAGASPSEADRQWAIGAHLAAFVGAAVALAFVGPLVVWLVKKDGHPFVERHAREALNFNLTLLVLLVLGVAISFATLGIGVLVVLPIALILGVAWIVFTIVAAIRASNGEAYTYPLTWRFVGPPDPRLPE